VRINFRLDAGATTWNATQLALYDQVIANARNAGLQVLGLFSNETTAGGQAAWNVDPNGAGLNSYVTAFASNARLLVDRYRNDVKQWEVWNEPNAWSPERPPARLIGGDALRFPFRCPRLAASFTFGDSLLYVLNNPFNQTFHEINDRSFLRFLLGSLFCRSPFFCRLFLCSLSRFFLGHWIVPWNGQRADATVA
jgi:hypothetical protein